jgi:hypothetical protein
MSGSVSTLRLRFDTVRQAQAIFVTLDTSPQEILEALGFSTLPNGVISISGGAKQYPRKVEEDTVSLVEEVIVPLVYEHGLLVIDGGTEAGIMKITGEVLRRARYRYPIIIGDGEETIREQPPDFQDPRLLGFVPEPKVTYPGVERPLENHACLDPNHVYFVMVRDARDWGEEVECMFSFVEYLATQKQIPVINIVANGGRITIQEVYHAVRQGQPVVVLEGSERAAEVIIAALDGVAEREIIDLLKELGITNQEHKVSETIHWLSEIAEYNKITRFDFLSNPPEELRNIILTELRLL